MSSIRIRYTPSFVRQYKKLPASLQEEVREKIALFATDPGATTLKAHKLKGRPDGFWSFCVNYAYRIVFEYEDKKTVALLKVGDHQVYK